MKIARNIKYNGVKYDRPCIWIETEPETAPYYLCGVYKHREYYTFGTTATLSDAQLSELEAKFGFIIKVKYEVTERRNNGNVFCYDFGNGWQNIEDSKWHWPTPIGEFFANYKDPPKWPFKKPADYSFYDDDIEI